MDPPDLDDKPYTWDPDGSIRLIAALSRLVQPNNFRAEYAARLVIDPNGVRQIIPGRAPEHSRGAFVSPFETRFWLTEDDAAALAGLCAAYKASASWPPRVSKALWNHEYGTGVEFLDLRAAIMAGALEALIHTDRRGSTAQFVSRVPALANDLALAFDRDEAEEAYDLRSQAAHGVPITFGDDEERNRAIRLCSMERVLRGALRRAFEDPGFCVLFSTDDRIRERWPVGRGDS